ncbi:hypothetical protein Btru_046961 [Bulinus truncatus]|nr:hypothetical protein Btru_046961 [Bulinus truncatus]
MEKYYRRISYLPYINCYLIWYFFNEALINKFDIFFNCFCLHILSLLGVASNVLNIIVLRNHGGKETTTIWLMSMSLNDLISSVLHPLRRLNCIIDQFDPVNALTFRAISIVYLFGIPDIFISVSVFHTVAIAVERLVAVWFPLRVSRIFTVSRVKWTIGLMYAYTLILLSPTWFYLDFTYVFDKEYNATRGAYALSPFYASNYQSLNNYANGCMTYLFSTTTFLAITICSIVVAMKLTIGRRKALSKLSSVNVTSKQTKDLKVFKMLLTVCLVNSAISLPTIVMNQFLLYCSLTIVTAERVHYLLRSASLVLYQMNAAVNFIIYVTMSSKFATTLASLCPCSWRKK